MAEETTAPATQAEATAQPQAGTSSTPAEGESEQQSISLDEAKKLRSEANSLRRRLKELEDAKKADDDAKLSEQERVAKKATDLEQRLAESDRLLRERTVRYATVASAARLGFADPEDAIRLIDADAIEFDDAGDARNVGDLLGALAKAKPYLLAGAKPAVSFDTGNGAGRTTPTTFTRDQLRDPKFYAEHAAEITEAAKGGRISN